MAGMNYKHFLMLTAFGLGFTVAVSGCKRQDISTRHPLMNLTEKTLIEGHYEVHSDLWTVWKGYDDIVFNKDGRVSKNRAGLAGEWKLMSDGTLMIGGDRFEYGEATGPQTNLPFKHFLFSPLGTNANSVGTYIFIAGTGNESSATVDIATIQLLFAEKKADLRYKGEDDLYHYFLSTISNDISELKLDKADANVVIVGQEELVVKYPTQSGYFVVETSNDTVRVMGW
jgi:hypothetical protein